MDIETLAARIQRLEDIEEIKQLKARYCSCCDDHYNPDGIAELFALDGVWDGADFGVFRGRDEIREFFLKGSDVFPFTIHQVMNPIIEIDGDTARGSWYLLQPAVQGDKAVWLAARYADEYTRVDGKWLFQKLKTTTLFFAPYAEGWAKSAMS